MKGIVSMPKSKFLRVLCKKCKNEQIIFDKAANVINCFKCNTELALPSGGKVRLTNNVKVVKELS
ncbi:MAG: 30S ribosomal protein S27e [Candidatus Aenigmatarchaeota archaeon]